MVLQDAGMPGVQLALKLPMLAGHISGFVDLEGIKCDFKADLV